MVNADQLIFLPMHSGGNLWGLFSF